MDKHEGNQEILNKKPIARGKNGKRPTLQPPI